MSWKSESSWLNRVASDPYSAHCAECLKPFKIDNQGIGQVNIYAKCHERNNKKKDALKSFLTKRTIVVDDGNCNQTKKNIFILSVQVEVTKADVLGALSEWTVQTLT